MLTEAKAKVIFWLPVTEFLPREQAMGTVKYVVPEKPPDTVEVDTEVTPTPTEVKPTPAPAPVASPGPEPSEPLMPWWVEVIVFIAIATTVFNIAWFLRHRRRQS